MEAVLKKKKLGAEAYLNDFFFFIANRDKCIGNINICRTHTDGIWLIVELAFLQPLSCITLLISAL